MNKKVLDTLNEYNEKGKYGDKKFVDNITKEIVDEYDLHNYLKKTTVHDGYVPLGINQYNPFRKELTISLDDIRKSKPRILLGEKYPEFYNFDLLLALFHEYEHIKEEKVIHKMDKTLEEELILLNNYIYLYPNFMNEEEGSFRDKIHGTFAVWKYNYYYLFNHDKAPTERMANIKAHERISEVIENVDQDKYKDSIREFKFYASNLFLKQIKKGYKLKGDMTNSPSLDYLSRVNILKPILFKEEILEDGKDLSYKERVTLGLPITKDEYQQLSKETPYVLKKK